MTTMPVYLTAALIALASGIIAIYLMDRLRARAKVNRRMMALGEVVSGNAEATPAPLAIPQAGGAETAVWITWLQQRYPLAGGARTGAIAIGVGALALVVLLAVLIFVKTPPWLAVTMAIAGAIGAGWGIGSMLENGKREEYNDRLLVAMDDFQRMVRFGIPTLQALTSASEAAEEPLRSSLRNVLLETGFGVPLEQAIATEARRIRMSELAMLAAILSTQASTGGTLSESVGNLAMMLRERRDNRSKMKAATAESRITLVILALVPVIGVGIQGATDPDVVKTLFGEARHLLGIGLALITGAFVLSWLFIRSAQR